jgi:UTP-glucose-1-phosphate uridylyltransferase
MDLAPYPLTIAPRFQIRKAIIPVAGFGTRLYPVTRAIKKEFLPVVDADGPTKPVILILLEQLYDSGIEEIAYVGDVRHPEAVRLDTCGGII